MSRSRDSFNEINITPLTDIFLVLLVIMMIIAPMLDQQGLNLVVPDNVEAIERNDKNNKLLNILVSSEDKYFFEGEEIAVTDLAGFIKEKSTQYTEGLVIQTESDASHGAVVRLMDIARNTGSSNITLTEI